MKSLPFLLRACLVTNSFFFPAAPFHRSTTSSATGLHQPFSSPLRFPATSGKKTDTSQTPLVALPNGNRIFEKVEIEASIDPSVWRAYLQNRLQPFFDSASANIPVGNYRVAVRFVVEVNRRISGATALNDPGYGLAKAAEDVVREGPRWKPGKIFEGVVRSHHTQPIVFIITPEECGADTAGTLMISP